MGAVAVEAAVRAQLLLVLPVLLLQPVVPEVVPVVAEEAEAVPVAALL